MFRRSISGSWIEPTPEGPFFGWTNLQIGLPSFGEERLSFHRPVRTPRERFRSD